MAGGFVVSMPARDVTNIPDIVTAAATALGTVIVVGGVLRRGVFPPINFQLRLSARPEVMFHPEQSGFEAATTTIEYRNDTNERVELIRVRALHGFQIAPRYGRNAVFGGELIGGGPQPQAQLQLGEIVEPGAEAFVGAMLITRPRGAPWTSCVLEFDLCVTEPRRRKFTRRVAPTIVG